MAVDLRQEQQTSLARPRLRYSPAAKLFFFIMDLITGKKTTLAKAKLIEILAGIPYRAWENRQYTRMTRRFRDPDLIRRARRIAAWGREAQDNEYWHLLVIDEKMKEDGIRDPWYLSPAFTILVVGSYKIFARLLALFSIRRAFLFNAEFEDHAEHVYARFVEDHPEWEEQPAQGERAREAGDLMTWADVFRRIGLDERDHMNNSFIFSGSPESVVEYEGMPEIPA